MIQLYSKNNCPFCDKAKSLLKIKGIAFEEVKVDEIPTAYEFLASEGHRAVPQLYQNGKLLVAGGYNGLAKQSEEFFDQLKGQVC